MSALRLSRPGYPTQLIDLGPAVGRRHMTHYGIAGGYGNPVVVGGSLVKGVSELDHQRRVAKAYKEANADLIRQKRDAYYQANRERMLEMQRRRRAR